VPTLKALMQNPRILPMIIGVMLTAVVGYMALPPDFIVSVEPIAARVNTEGSTETKVVVEHRFFFHHYDRQVFLAAPSAPEGIKVRFSQEMASKVPIDSTMTIDVDPRARTGYHIIEIDAIGGDGKEHICKFIINIIDNSSG
jgi:hypothetical protein